jgi:hypothetical protein
VINEFDFRFHADRSACVGTQYFEIVPGPYRGAHWVKGGRFIDEYTFSLFEGIFEKRIPDYDHFAFVNIHRPHWNAILSDISELRERLLQPDLDQVELPYGSTLRIGEAFGLDVANNGRCLAALLSALEDWLRETLIVHECISVLGL